MSRIFEALQQSELDRSGTLLPESPILVATEVLRAAESSLEHKAATQEAFDQTLPLYSRVADNSRIIASTQRWSLGAEKFRLLSLRLRQMQQRRKLNKVLITSTLAEEGKSFVSINLAITMARKEEQKVLLVEGDLRRPVLANTLGLGHLFGLAECLEKKQPLSAAIRYVEDLKLWILPSGRPPENPVEVMQSGDLADKLGKLGTSFDWIVIDSPPLLPLADTSLWSRIVDGTLLVTRQGKTEKKQLKRGLEMLDKSSILGVIVNDCSAADHNNYYQRYGYSSSKNPNPEAFCRE